MADDEDDWFGHCKIHSRDDEDDWSGCLIQRSGGDADVPRQGCPGAADGESWIPDRPSSAVVVRDNVAREPFVFIRDESMPKPIAHHKVIQTTLVAPSKRQARLAKARSPAASSGEPSRDSHQALASRMLVPSIQEAARLCSTSTLADEIDVSRSHVYPMMHAFACAAYDTVREAMS
eukprot:9338957-Pyramimonas_sp.AAC.2